MNHPYFEVNGKRYEIKRTRYLMAEFDKAKSEIEMTAEEEVQMAKEQEKRDALERLAKRKEELYDIYLETFDPADEAIYNRACEAYDRALESIGQMENVTGKQNKKTIDMAEKIIIRSLQLDDKGNEIRSAEEANEIWCAYVDENGKLAAMQFIVFAANYLIGNDEDNENPFVAQAKAKAEQQAQKRREGLRKAR